ncbi:hypothetical protein CY34DRAFT_101548, partial [Suillus luteus UH-Slu-Lm8-n1]
MLLHGLPETPQWVVFRSLTLGLYNKTTPSSTSASTAVTFEDVAAAFTEEANRQRGQLKLARPGSEYTNAVAPSSSERRTNPSNGIRIHKQNPKGVPCENPACSGLPRSMTHDRDHCLQPGGGMEGKAPWNQQRSGKKKDVAAAASEAKPPAPAPPTPSETTALVTTAPTHRRDWSCAMIEAFDPSCTPSNENVAYIASQSLSTILDSGTTSTLITSREYFWTYNPDAKVSMKTANHGTLTTSGRGDCVADLRVGNHVQRLRLGDCLHAPGALINLMSVGRMLNKGWECNFKPSPPRCQLVFCNDIVGDVPLMGNLVFLDLRFIPPSEPSPHLEVSAFAKVPLSWDLWHA